MGRGRGDEGALWRQWFVIEGLEKVRLAINLVEGVDGKFKEAKNNTTKTIDGI